MLDSKVGSKSDMKEIELKLKGEINRLTNKTFKFDERVGEGWFSAVYF